MNKMYKVLVVVAVVAVVAVVIAVFYPRPPSSFMKFGEMQIGKGEVGMLFLGDSAFVLKTINHAIIVDPAAKVSPDAVRALGKVNAILITHEHSDHFAASATLEVYRASDAVVVANKGAYESLKVSIQRTDKLIELEPGETTAIDGIIVEAIASNHSGLSPVMYVISMDNITILHASDSGFSPSLEKYAGKIDIALLPTGSPSPTASPSQAFKMTATLRPKKVIPMHGSSAEYSEFRRLLANSPGVSLVEVPEHNPQKLSVP